MKKRLKPKMILFDYGLTLLHEPDFNPFVITSYSIHYTKLYDEFDQKTYEIPGTDPINGNYYSVGSGTSIPGLLDCVIDIGVLSDKSVSADLIADFLNQLANGQTYIRTYLKKNAEGCYDEKTAFSNISYFISNNDQS